MAFPPTIKLLVEQFYFYYYAEKFQTADPF